MLKELYRTFTKTPLSTLIEEELYGAKRKLLEAQTMNEHWDAQVSFRERQVIRLTQLSERK